MNLFKYRPINEGTIASLINCELFFSDPRNFNDPIDSTIDFYDENVFDKILIDQLNEYIDFPEKQKALYSIMSAIKKEELQSQINLNSNKKICCFSAYNDNILMWSHYADSHKGICLIFKTSNEFKSSFLPIKGISLNNLKFSTVTEKDERYLFKSAANLKIKEYNYPVHKINYSDSKIGIFNFINGNWIPYYLVKTKNWEYEGEYRIVLDAALIKTNPIKFHKRSLAGIILGAKIEPSNKLLIQNISKKYYNGKLKIYEASFISRKIEISQLDA